VRVEVSKKKEIENTDIRIKFCGANGIVTGSCTHLTFPNGLQIIIDCGLLQDSVKNFEETQKINTRTFEFDTDKISHVILTHAHLDHVGKLPVLTKDPLFKGKILATVPTTEFSAISLLDCAYLNGEQCGYENDKRARDKRVKNKSDNILEPLYTSDEAQECICMMQGYDFNKEVKLDSNTSITFLPGGHMLGAAMILIKYRLNEYKTKTILFTGDTSGKDGKHAFVPIASDIGDVDYVICESTYGDRLHPKNNPLEIMTKAIQETCVESKRTLLIASFSIQRSSELLWLLREVFLKQNGAFNKIPVYLDSPMAIKSQKVVDGNREFWNERDAKRDDELGSLFLWKQAIYTTEAKASKSLANGEVKIIIGSGGMAQGGRILKHLANFLPSKHCKVMFTGFQGNATLGKRLLETKQKTINIEGKPVKINAGVELMAFSSHADYNQILELLKTSKKGKLEKIFINHGNPEGSLNLQKLIDENLHIEAVIPEIGEIFKI
jgi:metallo-beta-lactamase family protein